MLYEVHNIRRVGIGEEWGKLRILGGIAWFSEGTGGGGVQSPPTEFKEKTMEN